MSDLVPSIPVFIAFTMDSNPGRAASAVTGLIGARPLTYARIVASGDEVTNHHAAWDAIDLALIRLNGRRGLFYTTFSGLSMREDRAPCGRDNPYFDLASRCQQRFLKSGSSIHHIHDCVRSKWIDMAKASAQERLRMFNSEESNG